MKSEELTAAEMFLKKGTKVLTDGKNAREILFKCSLSLDISQAL